MNRADPTPAEHPQTPHRIVDGYCFDCEGGGCILELAEANSRRIRRASRTMHPWDEWDLEANR